MKRSKLKLKIMGLFLVIIFASFIPEMIPEFFGDWKCEGFDAGCRYTNSHAPTIHYGFRHWMWILMGFILFMISIVNIIEEAELEEEK